MTITCKNCNQTFKGNFCGNCGQKADTHEINLQYFWHEIQHLLLHIDKGILYTTKQLFVRPGNTIREYINGKRVKHFKPIAFAFILSTIYALASHYSNVTTLFDEISGEMNGSDKDNNHYKVDFFNLSLSWLKIHYAYGALLLIPIFSLASYLAFYKSGYNYFKHLILNTFITGQRTIVYIIFIPIIALLKDKDTIDNFQDAKVVSGIILTVWTFIQFFNTNSKLKSFLLTLLTYFILVILFFLIVIIIGIISRVVTHE